MKIANPIYDAAFKYLMEDTEIAKALIGKIIKEEIVELTLKPREVQHQSDKYIVVILRVDFKAVIKTKEGTYKNVLIEIQKGKKNEDILRFRKYLAANYKKEDVIKNDKGEEEKRVLPIITIYFLGFPLKNIKTPVVRTKRNYEDLVTDLSFEKKEDFIEQLTHDTFVIQIPRLEQEERAEIEGVLKVFNQDYKLSDDKRLVELSDDDLNKYQLLKKIAQRLKRAASDEDVLAKMDLEDEVDNLIEKHIRENQLLKETLEKKDKVLEKLNNEKISAVKSLIISTNLTDEQISAIQKMDIKIVEVLRKDSKK
jgi:hypothetical protein